LTPTDRELAVEREQAGWRPAFDNLAKGGFVFLARTVVIRRADSPIHAPTPVASAVLAEEVFKRGPEVGCERADRENHSVSTVLETLRLQMIEMKCCLSASVGINSFPSGLKNRQLTDVLPIPTAMNNTSSWDFG
jgi:hypothetical protein